MYLNCEDNWREWLHFTWPLMGVKVLAPHVVRHEHVAAVAVLLELGVVQLHWLVLRLVVERHKLGAAVPHVHRVVVGGVDARALRVDADQLLTGELQYIPVLGRLQQAAHFRLTEGAHLSKVGHS